MELEGSHFIKVAGLIVPHENAQVFVARAAMSANVSDLDPVYSHPIELPLTEILKDYFRCKDERSDKSKWVIDRADERQCSSSSDWPVLEADAEAKGIQIHLPLDSKRYFNDGMLKIHILCCCCSFTFRN